MITDKEKEVILSKQEVIKLCLLDLSGPLEKIFNVTLGNNNQ